LSNKLKKLKENGEFWNIISKCSIFDVEFSNLHNNLTDVMKLLLYTTWYAKDPHTSVTESSSNGAQYVAQHSKRELDEEKSKHASLAQKTGLGQAFCYRMMLRLVKKGTADPNSCC